MKLRIALAATAVMLTATLAADEIHVPGEYATIQEAIDAAVPGDTVLIEMGDYAESIDFNGKDIEVRSVSGADVTRLVGSGTANGVTFANGESAAARLVGLTVTGFARGIFMDHVSAVIEACRIEANGLSGTTSKGAGVYIDSGDAQIIDCDVPCMALF